MWGRGEGKGRVWEEGGRVHGANRGLEGEVCEVGAVNKQDLIVIKAIKT